MTDELAPPAEPKPRRNHIGRRNAVKVDDRRTQILKLYLEHFTQEQIANALGVAQSTISRDIQAIEAEWRKERQRDIEDHKARMLADLEAVEQRAIAKAAQGDQEIDWTKIRLAVLERKAKLLGVDAPKEIKQENSGTVSITYTNRWDEVKAD